MKIVLVILFCLLCGFNAFAQTDETNEEANIEQISLWHVGTDGKASEETESFLTTDKPLLFRIQLSSLKPATVKMVLVAADVKGLKPETKSVTISFTTNGKQNIVNFKAMPESVWLAGKYRADVFINGKPAGNKEFMIENPPNSNETVTPKTSTKPIRRARKN
ncbi:hypothetical protein BH10ACI1_BH10ACI1_13820 [soil metagenome]